MSLNTGYLVYTGGWWDDTEVDILEDDSQYTDGWYDWSADPDPQERLDRIEDFLRAHKFIKIDNVGDETEVRYPW